MGERQTTVKGEGRRYPDEIMRKMGECQKALMAEGRYPNEIR